jgi:L-threonylcarbamoyladenylate synthase
MSSPPRWSTTILPIESPGALEEALDLLRSGEVVAFPTDTVYGVGVAADNAAAVERLYQVKGRPADLALPLLLADAADLERVCHDVPQAAWELVQRFWPGGLTLVLPRSLQLPDRVSAGRRSVAVRLPDHAVPRELARRLGMPLASSSANRSGAPPAATAEQVAGELGGRIPLVLDGGRCRQEQASTILDLTVAPPAILREGPVSRLEIERVLGEVAR